MRTSKCQRFIPSFSFISCHFYIPYDSFHQLALAKDVHYECHFSSFNLKYYQKSPFNHTISKKIIVKKIDLIFLQYNRSLKEQKSVQITWSNYLTTSKKLVILGKNRWYSCSCQQSRTVIWIKINQHMTQSLWWHK